MSRDRPATAHFSIHDVEPHAVAGVRELVTLMRGAGLRPPLLLVVVGAGWNRDALEELRSMVADGCTLAGHGWSHRAPEPTSLGHRAHAALLSRDQAEHLSRSREEVRARVRRCHAWFVDHAFEAPSTYVPPAWAVGPLTGADLRDLPFRYWETLSGFTDAEEDRVVRLPLVGFEADTRFRRWALRISNAASLRCGRWLGRPVRVGFHPRDLELLLAEDAREIVRRPWRDLQVEELF